MTLKIDTEDATPGGQTSKYIDASLKMTTVDGTSKVQTYIYIDTPLKLTTENATTKGQTSNRIDTTLKMTTGDISTLAVECEIGWLMLGTGCYQFTLGGTRQMWLDAKDICSLNGGYLAIIETAEENVLIKTHIATKGPTNDYFIGGSDLVTEGKFIWEHTGLPVNLPGSNLFHDWRTNQPDNKNGNQHCIMLGYQVSFNWNDAQCAYPRDFICEKSPVYE
ncbi:perlucin-like [Mytilus trossulus]|uniref:perlucin-like n=1 Tax=Mytilus trossulus TaxID=6551 RepID=UPI003007EFE7